MNMTTDTFWHLSPFILMFGMVALNHLITHHRTEQRYAIEAARLSAALRAELVILQDLYRTNLRLIEDKADHLFSGRVAVLVYKGNLGRLTSLFDSNTIEQLVAVFARNEMIEFASCGTRGMQRRGRLSLDARKQGRRTQADVRLRAGRASKCRPPNRTAASCCCRTVVVVGDKKSARFERQSRRRASAAHHKRYLTVRAVPIETR